MVSAPVQHAHKILLACLAAISHVGSLSSVRPLVVPSPALRAHIMRAGLGVGFRGACWLTCIIVVCDANHADELSLVNDAASILTSSTYSSAQSEDAASLFDSGSSIVYSDTSSARGSIMSNMSARTSKLLGRKGSTSTASSAHRLEKMQNLSQEVFSSSSQWDVSDAASTHSSEIASVTNAAKQKGTFMCGFCKEEGILKTCTRKNDLKRHIEDFHNTNAQWYCQHRGCNLVFDWPTVYKTHLKHTHGGSRANLDDAKVALCPQTVFACGFETCIQVFEAASDSDASALFKEYVAHVVKHLDEGSNSGEWDYSTRMRNLMRQSGVLRAWQNSSWPEADRNRLTWLPQNSLNLRKRLETRHLGDVQVLVQYAVALASNHNGGKEMHQHFPIPVQDDCRMQINGHKPRQPAPPVQTTQAPEADPFQFKISRGPPRGAPPQLANYMATQRRVYPPRPPVRSGRSARPPVHTMSSSSSHGYHQPTPQPQPPTPNMFDHAGYYAQHPTAQQHPAAQHHPTQQQHPHQQFAMMPPGDGGIIADDLRSLRSLASSNASADVDMGDTQMMDPGYLSHPGFSGSYAPSIQSTNSMEVGDSGDIKMEQPNHFNAYGSHNGY